jgi:dUTPase
MPGDRIAQLVFTRTARAEFTIVTAFGDPRDGPQEPTARGGGRQAGGFGSTGIASACPNPAVRRQS